MGGCLAPVKHHYTAGSKEDLPGGASHMKKVQDLLTDAGKFPPWETSIYIKLQKGRLDPSSISDILKSLHNAAKKGDLVVQDRPFLQQQNQHK